MATNYVDIGARVAPDIGAMQSQAAAGGGSIVAYYLSYYSRLILGVFD